MILERRSITNFVPAKRRGNVSEFSQPKYVFNNYGDKSFEELGITGQDFQILFRNLNAGVALAKIIYNKKETRPDLIALEVNATGERIFGIKRNEIICKEITDSPSKKMKGEVDWTRFFCRVATTGKPESFQTYFKPDDKWYQIHAYSPKKDYVVSILMDITEQKKRIAKEIEHTKKAKQDSVISEKRYRRLYETTHDGIMARDLQGRMIDCNQAYAKMLGYSKKELKYLSVEQILPEKWYDQRERVVNKVLETGRSIVFEREYKRKNGSIFPASVRTWRLTDGKGKVIGVWSIVREITEQKALQKSLEQYAGLLEKTIEERTKQLKDSERLAAIGQTAAMVGHDLRNPLQTVIGELYLARKELESLSENEPKNSLEESIQIIEEQSVYMDKIVSDLQAFVKPVKVDKKLINLKQLSNTVLDTVDIPSNIEMHVKISSNFPQVKADPELLKRVLINLVTNAVQAMPKGGKLFLGSKVNDQGQICVNVEDTGIGIHDKIKPQIFTPLFTTKPRGQGFGLAVCKRVIEAHGGTIGFESQAGKGAKFTIQLPIG